ncbi:MAG: hypothetical protein II723_03545 [Oscillospiraceae bacterium]|nr:hypothetical protein [Oscillospiraceae bacterium]
MNRKRIILTAALCLLSSAVTGTAVWFRMPRRTVTVPGNTDGAWKDGYNEGYSQGKAYGESEVANRIAPEVIAGESAPSEEFGKAFWRLGWQKGYAEGAALQQTPETAAITVGGSFTAEVLSKTDSGGLVLRLCAAGAPFDAPFFFRTDAALSAQTEAGKAYTFTVPAQTRPAVPADWLKAGSDEVDCRILFSAAQPAADAVREADETETEPMPAGTPSCQLTGRRIAES